MKIKTVLATTAIALASATAFAQTDYTTTRDTRYDEGDLFRANEFSFDIFGSVSAGQSTLEHFSGNRLEHNARLGVGVGLNYFFTRNFGFSADAYSENTDGRFIDSASGNLVFRWPFEEAHVAPYIFGGGGRQFEFQEAWFGQGGVGVDIRVNRNWGFFVDGRYVIAEGHEGDYGLGRAGLRFAF